MPQLRRSTCPFDCPDACGLLVEVDVEAGRALAVRGDPEHPWSRGSLCPKMTAYERTVHAPGRLATPLLRDGPKGEGRFRRASWDEAVALVAARWRAIVAEHGAEAILPYSYAGTMGLVQRNAGHAFFHALGASRLERTICSPAKEAAWSAVMGDTLAPDPEEIAESDLVVVWGLDAVATHLHLVPRLKEARARGVEVLLVDTYRTPTARVADRTFLVRPGTDGALALGLLHLLAREDQVDRAFVAAHVLGFDALEREVLPEWTPARTAAVTGLSPEDLAALAGAIGRARAPFFRIGSGLSRYGNGCDAIRAILALPAARGAWAVPGGGALCSTSSGLAFDLSAVTRPDLQPRPTRLVNMNQLGHALSALDGPRVMSLYVYHSNPAAVAPDQNAVLAGLAREDLFTVVHERFLTDTARYADVVLPATSSLEHPDLYRAYGHYNIQRVRAAIPPVGEARPNWEVFQAPRPRHAARRPLLPARRGRPDRPPPGRALAAPGGPRPRRPGGGEGGAAGGAGRGQDALPHPFREDRAPPAAAPPAHPRGGERHGAAAPPHDGALPARAQLDLPPGARRPAPARRTHGAAHGGPRRGRPRALPAASAWRRGTSWARSPSCWR